MYRGIRYLYGRPVLQLAINAEILSTVKDSDLRRWLAYEIFKEKSNFGFLFLLLYRKTLPHGTMFQNILFNHLDVVTFL